MTTKRFKVALSFPGERRDYVSQVADILAEALGGQDNIFYDRWHQAVLAQFDMDVLLQSFYHDHAELIVPFLCADYERKEWCGLEWRAIKDLIKQKQHKKIMPMRFDNTPIPGFYGTDGYVDLNDYRPQEVADLILQRLRLNSGEQPTDASTKAKPKTDIHIDRLPTVSGGFFGRGQELQLLDNAFALNEPRIIQFIAAGGTGKTKLLRHWLNQHDVDIPNRIVWSFYSQGSAEDKQVSASPFFSEAFKALRADKTEFSSEEEKGDYLAELLIRHRCLLVLDGLEPLQHVGKGMDGRLKDRAITRLLQKLAAQHTSLCVITTRIRVHNINDRPHVYSMELDNLQPADGVALLQSLGVKGSAAELDKAVREYGCHALALHLLGNALTTYLDGNIHKRDTLDPLLDENAYSETEKHAAKVMQSYQLWLTDDSGNAMAELQLLYLLGLFDHPTETEVLEVLWQAQVPGLTTDIPRKAWLHAIRNLREKHRLLSTHKGRDDLLDCHPLIREYFGGQLQTQQPEGWQQAHKLLYEYYKTLSKKEFPDTLEEMQPLFSAIKHGCAAGLHQQAFTDIYLQRIRRGEESYIIKKVGISNDDLAILASFFDVPWGIISSNLNKFGQSAILSWVGFRLKSQGRLSEAVNLIEKSCDIASNKESWANAAISSNNLSEINLSLGNLSISLSQAEQSVTYADKSNNVFQMTSKRTNLAYILFVMGKNNEAKIIFKNAETIQKKNSPYKYLYALAGFFYCEFLLDIDKLSDVFDRCRQWAKWKASKGSILATSLESLITGQVYIQHNNFSQAYKWINNGVLGLHESGYREYLPKGLLIRAILYRKDRKFDSSRKDLQEAYDIAEPSGMRLHLTDYHLEMARLLLAEKKAEDRGYNEAAKHVKAAAKLIKETGYHRRDKELLELQQALAKDSSP